ncbi:hypothetical protein QYM36_013777 [Artemia franciscana]|uniref:Lipid droplet-associated hydrolase n=1 Tax=Artemia franciscana TaxID=6661 RepID=A0AA88HRG2_ARTSF|nr:hypothetical protein QYM36_013777 [Artemia franciscana]
MLKIFKTLMEKVNVLGISHAGHDVGEKNIYNAPRLRDRPELYTLHGQIQHKKDFLDEYIPHGSRICFIGHSIGSKVVVELMSHLDQTRPNDPKPCGYLLFPTIERMAETPQGQRLRMLLGPFRTPAVYASYMVYFLPEFVKNALVSWYISQPEKEDLISSVGQALKTVVNPNVLEKSLYMANDELAVVRELDVKSLIRHGDRGTVPNQCLVSSEVVSQIPGLKIV